MPLPLSEILIMQRSDSFVIFNSMIDALNFMTKNGFEFVDAYAITVDNQNVYHYLLKNNKN